MHLNRVITAAAALFAIQAAASPVAAGGGPVLSRAEDDNCQNNIDSCFENGCAGTFANPGDTIGTCTAGEFNGCPCEKCGGQNGACDANGCVGVQGKCTAGQYQGCPCG